MASLVRSDLRSRFDDAVAMSPDPLGSQHPEELWGLFQDMALSGAKSYLEIGCRHGHSLGVLGRALSFGSKILGIDWPGADPAKAHSLPSLRAVKNGLSRDGYAVNLLIGDSHTSEIAQALASALRQSLVDYLLIDGDHSYQGVKGDFQIYRHFVHYRGSIAFHDIVPREDPDHWIQVPRFWREIRVDLPYKEFIAKGSRQGIGVIMKL